MIYENDYVYIQKHEHELPWVKIFTKTPHKEFSDCDEVLRAEILRCVLVCEKALLEFYKPTKVNIASFGNEVPRVHFHVIARFSDDAYFPNTTWGAKLREHNVDLPDFKEFAKFLKDKLINDKKN